MASSSLQVSYNVLRRSIESILQQEAFGIDVRLYIIMARRITSGGVLNYRNEILIRGGHETP